MFDSLWGEEFKIEPTQALAKKIIKKKKEPKTPVVIEEKHLKSKKIPIDEKIKFITEKVHTILGTYADNTVVIKTKEQLVDYIDKAIENGVIAVDTETNNSLQPITCKLMGPCLYTPGMKNAYVPINHVDWRTGERLEWQLTEQDVAEQLQRLVNTKIIMHNGKFDYQVIKCTCGVTLRVYWDTILAARILNENESAGLKEQYISKIDPSIEKYSIEGLFEDVPYEYFDPELFALYAATDSYMTYKLYLWQIEQFKKEEYQRLYDVFMNTEMQVLPVTADMELTGVTVDEDYVKVLSEKLHNKVDKIEKSLAINLDKYKDRIAEWRLTPEANTHKQALDKKGNPKFDKNGNPVIAKSLSEQLEDPLSITSPTQLAIFFYDILKCEGDKKKPRGTGADELIKLKEKYKDLAPLIDDILEHKTTTKLLDTFVDKLPTYIIEKTGKLHATFNQLGTDTGRYSSKEPNLQQIPSHEQSIRMMFVPQVEDHIIEITEDYYEVSYLMEVETKEGWKSSKEIVVGDLLLNSENSYDKVVKVVRDESKDGDVYKYYVEEVM